MPHDLPTRRPARQNRGLYEQRDHNDSANPEHAGEDVEQSKQQHR
jgi:hypothetical protein